MGKIRLAINGFGRVGRMLTRQITESNLFDFIELVAINDLQPLESLIYLFRFDSVHGHLEHLALSPYTVSLAGSDYAVFKDHKVKMISERQPEKLPWRELDVDIIVDGTGIFTTYDQLAKHLEAGAKRVVLTAPSKDEKIFTFTPNVNEENLSKSHLITSNASCTTNAAAPIIKAILLPLGLKELQIGTVHAYTASQALVDAAVGKKDLRGGRAAAENIVPSSTGASWAIPLLFPELAGKVGGYSVRVPVPDGSLLILTANVEEVVDKEYLNSMIILASKKDEWSSREILAATIEPLVSRDIIGNNYGSLVDLGMTSVVGGHMLTIGAWYDNEWGYSKMLLNHIFKVGEIAGFFQ